MEALLKSVESYKVESAIIDNSLLEIKTSFQESKEKFIEVWNKAKKNEQVLMNANIDPVAACVSPKDLETCKDLIKIGRLSFD